MIAVISDLYAQFMALSGLIVLLYGLSKVPFVRSLFHRNITMPFREWLADILKPTNDSIRQVNDEVQGVRDRLYELADTLNYEFKANGGGSLRDRVNDVAATVGAQPDPLRGGRDVLH